MPLTGRAVEGQQQEAFRRGEGRERKAAAAAYSRLLATLPISAVPSRLVACFDDVMGADADPGISNPMQVD